VFSNLHELTNLSLANIGKHFGNRDHSTVLHAIKKIKLKRNKKYEDLLSLISREHKAYFLKSDIVSKLFEYCQTSLTEIL
jgi:hypothetical protein